ncbi:MAG: hypothetical protein K0R90_1458 [Oscillospiraceae bacterium]|jgi:serine protease Do|nr:hypothetical protein [Oscillospiraceae bacterium]
MKDSNDFNERFEPVYNEDNSNFYNDVKQDMDYTYKENSQETDQQNLYPYNQYEEQNPIYQSNYAVIPHRDYTDGIKNKKRSSKKVKVARIIAACMLLSAASGFGGSYLSQQIFNTGDANSKGVIYQSVVRTSTGTNDAQTYSVADIAALTANSIVEITTETVTTGDRMGQYISQGAGSGVIITTDGYIATNNHVIDGASKISVRLKDGKTYTAKLIGKDSQTDLAVIKIDVTDLTPAVMGDSSKLVVGETVVAIGNPLGQLGGTVTDGIISALDREITIDGESMTLLQTNAAINPGNSGGGLFNGAGELVGIVNAKSSGSDVEGLGFAIPIKTAKTVIEEIMKNGYVTGRVQIGINVVDILDTQTAMMYRVQELGVYILKATEANSQFQAGDRIVSIDGTKIESSSNVSSVIQKHSVGDVIKVVVERNNTEMTLSITLKESTPS